MPERVDVLLQAPSRGFPVKVLTASGVGRKRYWLSFQTKRLIVAQVCFRASIQRRQLALG